MGKFITVHGERAQNFKKKNNPKNGSNSCGGDWKQLVRKQVMRKHVMRKQLITIPYRHTYSTVASAPTVTGSGSMQRLRLFSGQCMLGFPFELIARFSWPIVDLMEWWYQSVVHQLLQSSSSSKCISGIASI